MLLGFIDDGSWHEKGALYLEVPFAPVMNQKKFNEIIINNYSQELIHKGYFEIAYVEVRDFVSIQMQHRFELYSKDGYLGDYGIEKFVILVNACGGGIYLYVKLNGRIIVKKQEPIIARLINDGMLKKKCKMINTVRLTKNEKLKIEEILSGRFLYAMDERNNIITKYFDQLRRGGWKRFAFKLEYSAFKGGLSDKLENEILINAKWHWDNEEFKSDTGYYLTTTFLVFHNKILDVIPLKLSSNSRLDIPAVLWGIDIDNNGNVEWVVLHRLWEGSVKVVMEWDDRGWRELYVSNYFGC